MAEYAKKHNIFHFLGESKSRKYDISNKRKDMRGLPVNKLNRGKIDSGRRSVKDVVNINRLIAEGMLDSQSDDISFHELPYDDTEMTIGNVLFENAPRFSYDANSGALIIRDIRGKAFRLVSDDKGNENLEFYEGNNAKIPEKIKYVEKLSKDLIDKSVKAGIEATGYYGAVNILHEIANSGVYNPQYVRLAARYAQGELGQLEILPMSTQAHIVNIRNTLRELSEI